MHLKENVHLWSIYQPLFVFVTSFLHVDLLWGAHIHDHASEAKHVTAADSDPEVDFELIKFWGTEEWNAQKTLLVKW